MKRKIFTLLTIVFVISAFAGDSFAKTRNKKIRQTNSLVAKLPVSDMVARVDLQRLMSVALPQVLNANPQMLADVNAKIEQIKSATGIDLRRFEQLAVGFKYQQIAPKNVDLQPVALASGKDDSAGLLTAIKAVAKDKIREEKSGTKTIYIFTPQEVVPNTNPSGGNKNIVIPGIGLLMSLDKLFSGEIAVAEFDKNILAIGKPSRVREILESKARVAPDVLALANRNAASVITFGGNAPADMAQFFGLEDDEMGRNLNSIKQMSGGMDFAGENATVTVMAKTATPKQAEELETTVAGLQMFGKSILGGLKGNDKAVYARIVDGAKISRTTDEVNLNLQIPQSDIDILVGKK